MINKKGETFTFHGDGTASVKGPFDEDLGIHRTNNNNPKIHENVELIKENNNSVVYVGNLSLKGGCMYCKDNDCKYGEYCDQNNESQIWEPRVESFFNIGDGVKKSFWRWHKNKHNHKKLDKKNWNQGKNLIDIILKTPKQTKNWSCGPNSAFKAITILGINIRNYQRFRDKCYKTQMDSYYGKGEIGPSPYQLTKYLNEQKLTHSFYFRSYSFSEDCMYAIDYILKQNKPVIVLLVESGTNMHYVNIIGTFYTSNYIVLDTDNIIYSVPKKKLLRYMLLDEDKVGGIFAMGQVLKCLIYEYTKNDHWGNYGFYNIILPNINNIFNIDPPKELTATVEGSVASETVSTTSEFCVCSNGKVRVNFSFKDISKHYSSRNYFKFRVLNSNSKELVLYNYKINSNPHYSCNFIFYFNMPKSSFKNATKVSVFHDCYWESFFTNQNKWDTHFGNLI